MKSRKQVQRQMELPLRDPDSSPHLSLPPEHRRKLVSALSQMLVAIETARQTTTSKRRSNHEVAQDNR
jgi:hypothetical protein